jgi:hypothetical protein
MLAPTSGGMTARHAWNAEVALTQVLARFRTVLHLGHLWAYAHVVNDEALVWELTRAVRYPLEP